MRFHRILSNSKGNLYSISDDSQGGGPNAFYACFDFWNDVSRLRDYFSKHADDYPGDIDQHILRVLNESKALLIRLRRMAALNLGWNILFTPLDNRIGVLTFHQPSKARPDHNPIEDPAPWLRLYAVRLDDNSYVVTGGAIKNWPKMENHDLTMAELTRLDQVVFYLKQEGIFDSKGI